MKLFRTHGPAAHLRWGVLGPIVGITAACSGGFAGSDGTSSTAQALSTGPGTIANTAAAAASFTEFDSGQVRPLALSPDGQLLFACNTPDGRLEIFQVHGRGLRPVASLPVGMEPVAVAVRNDREVWVVNHLSDSVSVVDVRSGWDARVVRTLLVGDEPRDVVFAGPGGSRAFITTAHRGQNSGRDPQLTTPGVGRADVWVFDANNLGTTLEGRPLEVLTLFTDTPRALAVSPDGGTVYAAGFMTGNQTTSINERLATNSGGLPPPNLTADGVPQPPVGLVLKFNGQHWVDQLGNARDAEVMFSLPDKDVFAIDANANPPAQKSFATGVGTVLFNMAVNPVSGKVYVSNTDANNFQRFEGHDVNGGVGSVRGHIAESRITVIDGTTVTPHHLNPHIDFSKDGDPAEAAKSLAFPIQMAVTHDGKSLFVAALGSSKVGVFDTAQLEAGTFVPSTANQIPVSGGGPTGVLLNEKHGLLYVLTRFDNSISILDTSKKQEVGHVAMFNPEPQSVLNGRHFLYDAVSTHGADACASCHIFSDFDALAWDLGDPDKKMQPVPGPFTVPEPILAALGLGPFVHTFLKGPMTTQSLRGLANHGPMHWRGDRNGGLDANGNIVPSAQPDTGTFSEVAAFDAFNVAFPGLVGSAAELSDADMAAFTTFQLQVTYPPNPIRALDNSLTPLQAAGRAFYFKHADDGSEIPVDQVPAPGPATGHNCNGCHVLDPSGNAQYGVFRPGFFGTDGRYSFEDETQFFKVPHLRNAYQKVGMFGMANTFMLPLPPGSQLVQGLPPPLNDGNFEGDQVRGFGFLHDGSVDTMFRFFGGTVFAARAPGTLAASDPGNPGITEDANGILTRRELEQFILAFDSNLAPIVGQQVTMGKGSAGVTGLRLDLIEARAAAGECDVVARAGVFAGWLYQPATQTWKSNVSALPAIPDALLRLLAQLDDDAAITFTAVPVGNGVRVALDRDMDGRLDGDL
jgi:DNA-binding beta-propeller fold protein YncE